MRPGCRPVPDCKPLGVESIETAAGIAWSEVCCTFIYLIIIGGFANLHSVRRGGGIWYVLEVLRRCDVLQRGAGDIIAACVGLVSWAVEWVKSQEKPL